MSRQVVFDRLHNFRDLGGYPTTDGRRVRWGRLYRSDSLGKLGGQDWDRFQALGIRTVIDLRYPWEADRWGRVPEGPVYHNLSIEHEPYDQAALGPEVDPVEFLAGKFAEVAEDGVVEIRQVLEVIARAEEPLVFHCASGKDRTGIVAALVLSLLGVEEEVIVEDFALTNLATGQLVADWSAVHEGRSPRWPAYGTAPADLMRRFLRELGPVEDYVKTRLGLDPALIDQLRAGATGE